MKKIQFIVMISAIMVLLLNSCIFDKKPSGPRFSSTSIIGQWQAKRMCSIRTWEYSLQFNEDSSFAYSYKDDFGNNRTVNGIYNIRGDTDISGKKPQLGLVEISDRI